MDKSWLLVLSVVTLTECGMFCNPRPKCGVRAPNGKQPHIFMIVGDDLGGADASYAAQPETSTYNIDSLAYHGIVLRNYGTNALCTASRGSIMSGYYAHHTGTQFAVRFGCEPANFPLDKKIISEYMRDMGYATHLVGKWHMGSWKKETLPCRRGFETHIGIRTGRVDPYSHWNDEEPCNGLDFFRNYEPANDLNGQFATHVFTNRSIQLIQDHDMSKPMFMMIAHTAVHSGNPYNPLAVPYTTLDNITNVPDKNRTRMRAAAQELDASVGAVIQAINDKGMLDNCIILFFSDNGGPTKGYDNNYCNNYPLRGGKATLAEGGVKVPAIVWSSKILGGRVHRGMFHCTDWLPSLYDAAGGDVRCLGPIDGLNQYKSLLNGTPSPRTEMFYNVEQYVANHSALVVDDYKLIVGSNFKGNLEYWSGPSGKGYENVYDYDALMNSPAWKAISSHSKAKISKGQVMQLRDEATIKCPGRGDDDIPANAPFACNATKPDGCMYNLRTDPCEFNDISEEYPDIKASLLAKLRQEEDMSVKPINRYWETSAIPEYNNFVFTTFGDNQTKATTGLLVDRLDIFAKYSFSGPIQPPATRGFKSCC